MNLEHDLKNALDRREPPPGFADRVLARLDEAAVPKRPAGPWKRWMAVAAGVLIAVSGVGFIEQQRAEQRRLEGERAKAELIFALDLASEKLQTTRTKVLKRVGQL